jgi:membrane fusion protein, multidrug efflux system
MSNRNLLEENKPATPGRADEGQNDTGFPRPGSSMAKKRYLAVIPLILLVAGYFIYERYFANRESTDDAQIDGHINPVSSKVPGMITELKVEDNQVVKAGEVVVRIDPRDYQVALDRARADLAAAEAGAAAAQAQVPMTSTTTSSQISYAGAGLDQAQGARTAALKDVATARARQQTAEARVRETQANHTKATQDLDRMKQLVAKDEISRQLYDAAVAAAEAARAARDSAQASVEEAAQMIEAAQARVVQAEARIQEARAAVEATGTAPQQLSISRSNALSASARVKQAQAAVAQAELNMGYTEVRAPISGIVSQRKAEVGQYLQAGQPLFSIISLEDVWVTANFKESQLDAMRPGQKVAISVDAYGGKRFTGQVDSIAAATGARFSLLPPENATGNYVKVVQRVPVKVTIDGLQDPQFPLRPGLSVVVTVMTDEFRNGGNTPPKQEFGAK